MANIWPIQKTPKSEGSESEWADRWSWAIKIKDNIKMGDHLGSIHLSFFSLAMIGRNIRNICQIFTAQLFAVYIFKPIFFLPELPMFLIKMIFLRYFPHLSANSVTKRSNEYNCKHRCYNSLQLVFRFHEKHRFSYEKHYEKRHEKQQKTRYTWLAFPRHSMKAPQNERYVLSKMFLLLFSCFSCEKPAFHEKQQNEF